MRRLRTGAISQTIGTQGELVCTPAYTPPVHRQHTGSFVCAIERQLRKSSLKLLAGEDSVQSHCLGGSRDPGATARL